MRALRRLTCGSFVVAFAALAAGAALAEDCTPGSKGDCAIDKKTTVAADPANTALGPPTFPGNGTSVEAYWAAAQRVAQAAGGGAAAGPAQGAAFGAAPLPAPGPAPGLGGGLGVAPGVGGAQMPQVTPFCSTPYGRYGPFPNLVGLGAVCGVSTPNGIIYGLGG